MVHPDWVSRSERAVPPELWQAAIPTVQGLKDTGAWYRHQGWL
jgi:hypothetical protein